MSADVGQVLADVLREQVRDVPLPAPGLVDRARRQARARRRQQVAAVAASALVLVAVLLAPSRLPGSEHRSVERVPAAGVGPAVSLAVPDSAVSVVDVATANSAGGPASVAWFSWRALHRSDGRVVRLPDGALGAVETPDGGALVTGGTVTEPTLTLVSADGSIQGSLGASRPVAGRDGQVAYVDLDRQEVVRIAADGWAATAPVAAPRRGLRLVGFLGTSVVTDTTEGAPRLIHRDGTSEPLRGLAEATASDGPSGTVASRSANGRCLELRRADRPLWHSCTNQGGFSSIVAISPDGHRVLLRRDKLGNPGASEYAVAVAETGQVLRLFAAGGSTLGLGQATFEGRHLLVVAYHDADSRIVRCDEYGACEVAAGDAGAGPTPFTPVWFP